MPVLRLDGNYTVFGRVIDGMEYVDAIPRGEPPANPARIIGIVGAEREATDPDGNEWMGGHLTITA